MQESRTPDSVRGLIAEGYHLRSDQVAFAVHDNDTSFQWNKDGVGLGIGMMGNRPQDGGAYYYSNPPLASQVIECLGTPDSYRAYYQKGGVDGSQNQLRFDLYLTEQGVLASGYEDGVGKNPPRLDSRIPLRDFRFVPVTTHQDTLERLSLHFSPQVRAAIKPWPGTWEDLLIDVDPALDYSELFTK